MNDALEREILGFLDELAALAGAAALPYFRTALAVEDKGGACYDPVTAADRGVETALRDAIRARYPGHGILGEEFGVTPGRDAIRWVLDPIDGTRAFVCGLPTWATLVGVCTGDTPCIGMMSQPYVGERFVGSRHGAWLLKAGERHRLATRATTELAGASLFATTPDMFEPAHEQTAFARLSAACRLTRFGVDSYAYCMLAAGFVDLVVEAGLGFYDIAPLVPIIEAAGGVVTTWDGAPVRSGGRVLAAANPALHAAASALLRDAGG